jgi:hypothetical protein
MKRGELQKLFDENCGKIDENEKILHELFLHPKIYFKFK